MRWMALGRASSYRGKQMVDLCGSSQPLISARGVHKAFGSVVALDSIDLDFHPGEFLTIFGPNGAGKTTLVKVLSTLTRPSAGTVNILGVDVREGSETARRQIGVIAHRSLLYPNLTDGG